MALCTKLVNCESTMALCQYFEYLCPKCEYLPARFSIPIVHIKAIAHDTCWTVLLIDLHSI